MSHLDYLKFQSCRLPVDYQELCSVVLDNERFQTWPASCDKHHPYKGGLVEHTAEVMKMCKSSVANSAVLLDDTVLTIACVWHDFGKIFDYEPMPDQTGSASVGGGWRKTQHASNVRHLVRSYAEFHMRAHTRGWTLPFLEVLPTIEAIEHCILAHHGRFEWGSPVEPKTPEAWALHLADMISVRCLARVKSPQK